MFAGPVANGWSINTDTVGVYGNYHLKSAILAQQALGANVVDDAIYPLNLADDTVGQSRWVPLHQTRGEAS